MKRGFTIIELLVAIAIFIVVTGLIVANFRRGARSDELRIAASGLASTLRRVQTMVQAGVLTNSTFPVGGYGVHVSITDPSHYFVFADFNNNKNYESSSENLETINLPPNILIDQITPASTTDIIFIPPKPMIYITDSPNAAEIILKDQISGQKRKVTVNRISGQINLE